MILLIISIILFNVIAFKTNKRLSRQEIAHLWSFVIAFQVSFDVYIDLKYQAYWYFSRVTDWRDLLPHTFLLPSVNMMFLNWYPFKQTLLKQIRYIFFWVMAILSYELLTLLPEPWGYFHYGWWSIWYSAIIDPILFIILLMYYKAFIKENERSLRL